jgi:GT2 family glycosyltransferase/glycosyltransferase involved in cell wall biosynthesis
VSVKHLSTELEQRAIKIAELEGKVKELNEQLERLRYDLEEATVTADHFADSYFWLIVTKYRDLLNRHLPSGTRRRTIWEWMFKHATKPTARSGTFERSQVHETKPFGEWIRTTRSLMSSNPRRVTPLRSNSVDIIIPVFNGLQTLQVCVDSILKHTTNPYRIVIVDDASTDPLVSKYLRGVRDNHIHILSNKSNLGFVESANLGFAFSKDDVVLLNSDAVVTPRWLDKMHNCAYSSEAIGTVTPLTNNGTICSIPKFLENNRIPEGFTVESFANLVESVSEGDYPPIPTAVGFCVYIKRFLLEKVGPFDSGFTPGYGEENDFCMRALEAGFLSVLDDATFVYHQGESSFTTRADSLRESHHQILLKKHPNYDAIVSEFMRANPLQDIHIRLNTAIIRGYQLSLPKIAYVMHYPPGSNKSGGAGKHCRLLYRHLDGFLKYVVYPQEDVLQIDEYAPVGKRTFTCPASKREEALISDTQTEKAFSGLLEEIRPDIVHFQHLLGMPLSLIEIASRHSAKIVVTLHDGYFLCRDFRMLEMGQKYCDGCTDLRRCDLCLNTRYDLKPGFQRKWREKCRAMLELADTIIVPSEYQRELCVRVLGLDRRDITVIEHVIPSPGLISIKASQDVNPLRVGFVGHVGDLTKGRDVILKLLQENTNVNVEWHFFGEESDIRRHIRNAHIKTRGELFFHGYYKEGDLPLNLADANIAVVVIPSIYGESYSYALTEVWRAGIPIVAADLGAIGERVRKNGGGWLYPLGSEPSSILKILNGILENPSDYKSKVREITSAKQQSFSEHISEYKHLYTQMIGKFVKPDLSSYPRYLDLSKPRLHRDL